MTKKASPLLIAGAIFLFLASIYLLTYSGEFHAIDEVSMFAVTENLVKHGTFNANQMLWASGWLPAQNRIGPDGNYYSKKGIGQSLAASPLYWAGLHLPPAVGLVQITMLTNVLVTALTGALLFLLLLELGFSLRTGVAGAMIFGLGTTAWPYTKTFFNEPLTALCLLASFYLLVRARRKPSSAKRGALSGLLFGLAVSSRVANLALAPGFIAYIVFIEHQNRKPGSRTYRQVAGFVLALLPVLLLLGEYNFVRFGSPFDNGYASPEGFTAFLPTSLYGFLFSPGKSIFVYSPVLLLSLFGLPLFWRRFRAETLLIGWIAATYLCVYGLWFMWWGGWSWGPRFLVPLIPFLMLPLAGLVDTISWRSRLTQLSVALLVLASVGVQLAGVLVDFNQYLADLLARGVPAEETIFHIRYWPVLGHLALARRGVLDMAWLGWGENGSYVAWPVVGLLLVVTCCALLAGYRSARRPNSSPANAALVGFSLLLLIAATYLGLLRFSAQPDHTVDSDQLALVEQVRQTAQPHDGLVLELTPNHNYFERAVSFMNAYRAAPPYYGIIRPDRPETAEQEKLNERIASSYRRLWLMTEGVSAGDPASTTERWYNQHAYLVGNRWFGSSLRLGTYSLPAPGQRPLLTQTGDARVLGRQIKLRATRLSVAEGVRPTHPLRVRPGDTLQLELDWEAMRPISTSIKVSVQLLDWRGELRLQEDRLPVGGFRPAPTWKLGEQITDRYGLVLPDDLSRGRYALITRLYRTTDGQRLRTAAGQDHILITELVLEPPEAPHSQ
ncbi:MAG: hypothetical protein GXP41_07505 [Chloroflexi bacterium]|nr:hypothetical protein [Chloroflexota bacterium]